MCAPPASPSKVIELTVGANDPVDLDGNGDTYHTVSLPVPIVVAAGQSLWVEVQQATSVRGGICSAICGWNPITPDLSYWSNGVNAPYAWSDFTAFGAGWGDLMVKATTQ